MRVISREASNYISAQFYLYFRRRERNKKMSYADALALIEYIGGPSPMPHDIGSMDYAQVRVQGGGRRRPSDGEIIGILERAEDQHKWDEVFDEVMRWVAKDQTAEQLILLHFKDGGRWSDVAEKLYLSEKTVYNYRETVITRAAILAYGAGILQNI